MFTVKNRNATYVATAKEKELCRRQAQIRKSGTDEDLVPDDLATLLRIYFSD